MVSSFVKRTHDLREHVPCPSDQILEAFIIIEKKVLYQSSILNAYKTPGADGTSP